MATVRKNITMSLEDYTIIKAYSKKFGLTFSEFLRTSALIYIERIDKMEMAEFFNTFAEFVDDDEQHEIEKLLKNHNIDLDSEEGVEVSLNDLL